MSAFDQLEAGEHDVTYCGMLMAGTQCYVCENCNAFILTRNDEVVLFHHNAANSSLRSTLSRCMGYRGFGSPLKDALTKLTEDDWERLRRDAF